MMLPGQKASDTTVKANVTNKEVTKFDDILIED